jgi:hypothetical protein
MIGIATVVLNPWNGIFMFGENLIEYHGKVVHVTEMYLFFLRDKWQWTGTFKVGCGVRSPDCALTRLLPNALVF